MLYILQMYFINESLVYSGNDPYFWFDNIWFVHKYGFLDYNEILSYPPGFVIFYSTMISPINDYMFFYYFFKYIPLFLSLINLLVLFVLSNDIFKKKIYTYFTLVMYLGFTFIFNRTNKSIPSILATSIGFLFLLFLGKGTINDIDLKTPSIKKFLISNVQNKRILLKGLLFTGISLTQPLYGLFVMVFYFFYECSIFFLKYQKNVSSFNPRLLLLRNFLSTQLLIIFIYAIFMSPFVIGTSLNRGAFILSSYFSHSINYESIYLSISISSIGSAFKSLGEWFLYDSFYNFVNLFFEFIFGNTHILSFYKETIQIGFFLIIFGLFLNFKKIYKLNEKQGTLINFVKFTVIFSLIIFFFCQFFVYFFNIPFISSAVLLFYEIYRLRLFELFSGYWAIIFVLAYSYIIKKSKKKYIKLKRNQIFTKRSKRILKISCFSSIIFTSCFFYFINFEKIDYPVYFDENQVQSILFIGNYFNENPLEKNKTILLEDFENNNVYSLIVDINLEKKYYNFTLNSNYTEFYNEFNLLNSEYVFFNISKVNESFRTNFTLYFDNINEWSNGYIFSKIK